MGRKSKAVAAPAPVEAKAVSNEFADLVGQPVKEAPGYYKADIVHDVRQTAVKITQDEYEKLAEDPDPLNSARHLEKTVAFPAKHDDVKHMEGWKLRAYSHNGTLFALRKVA